MRTTTLGAVLFALVLGVAGCRNNGSSSSGGGTGLSSNQPANQPAASPSPNKECPPGSMPSPTPTPSKQNPANCPTPSPSPGASPSPVNQQEIALYNDAGGILGQPNTLLFTGGGLTISEQTGGAAEGSKFLRAVAGPGGFWGITVDKNNPANGIDLSSFASGSLKLAVRVDRALTPADAIVINVTGAGMSPVSVALDSSIGFNPSSAGTWQDVSIPLSRFSGVNLSKVNAPFAVAINSPSGTPSVTIDIDNVRITK